MDQSALFLLFAHSELYIGFQKGSYQLFIQDSVLLELKKLKYGTFGRHPFCSLSPAHSTAFNV
jgi:hypothetical protein